MFEQFFQTFAIFCRNRDSYYITTPFFNNEVVLSELLFYTFNISIGFVYLVDGYNYRYFCRLDMVYRLNGLRHYSVISCNNQNSYICYTGTPGPHRGKSFMTWSINECNCLFINGYLICSDMLGNLSGLTCSDIGLSNSVE